MPLDTPSYSFIYIYIYREREKEERYPSYITDILKYHSNIERVKEEERYPYRTIQLYYIDLRMNPEDGILIYLSLWKPLETYP